jgi:nicotinamidase-related amidase
MVSLPPLQRETSMSNDANDNRLTPENAALLLVDHQTGLSSGVADQSQPDFIDSVRALLDIGRVFELPTVISTSSADGPNGPLIPDIREAFPRNPVVHRPGEINAWDNAEFVAAVKATGRKKMIIAGVSTEVCVAFLALSLVKAGHDAYAVIDASGTWNPLVANTAVARMVHGGVVPMTWLAVGAELQRDWKRPTGAALAKAWGAISPSTNTRQPAGSSAKRSDQANSVGCLRASDSVFRRGQ